jgi:hypothetical protein
MTTIPLAHILTSDSYQHGQPVLGTCLRHRASYQREYPHLALLRLQLRSVCGYLAVQDLWPLSLQCMP